MRTKIVDSSELSSKSLRASDYVTSPEKVADAVVGDWLDAHGLRSLLRVNGAVMKDLKKRVRAVVMAALEDPTT